MANHFGQQRAQLRRSLRDNWRQVRLRASNIRQLSAEATTARASDSPTGSVDGRKEELGRRDSAGLLQRVRTHVLLSRARGPHRPGLRASALRSGSCVRYKGSLAYFGPGCFSGGGVTDPDAWVHVAVLHQHRVGDTAITLTRLTATNGDPELHEGLHAVARRAASPSGWTGD